MLIESTAHLPISLAMFDGVFHSPNGDELWRIFLRWAHFVGGVTWIGLLYFFNVVNVPFQKRIDAETKKKINPDLLGLALWYFRWGAVVTVLAGLTYYAMVILKADVANANNIGRGNVNLGLVLLAWLGYPILLFIIEFVIIKKVPGLIKDGRVFAIVMFLLVALFTWGIVGYYSSMLTVNGESQAQPKGPFSWKQLPAKKSTAIVSGTQHDLFVSEVEFGKRYITHRRTVFNLRSQYFLVADVVEWGDGLIDVAWHFVQGLVPHQKDQFIYRLFTLLSAVILCNSVIKVGPGFYRGFCYLDFPVL